MGKTHAWLWSSNLTPNPKSALRDAATVIALRQIDGVPHVLMGQRGKNAAFMPDKFVFPGGAVDPEDAQVELAAPVAPQCHARLTYRAPEALAGDVVAAAIRELWEETGLIIGQQGRWQYAPPAPWKGYSETGHVPTGEGLHFVFRAITPPGRSRRFDARFFVADASLIQNDPDDFSNAEDELRYLQWLSLDAARALNLAFITEIVLSELQRILRDGFPVAHVPFFDNSTDTSVFRQIT